MLPQGMFSVAVATVLFPRLSRLATRDDMDGFRHTVALGLRQIAFTLIPASVFTAILATPITRVIYQRGAWGPHETAVTAGALAAFSLGLTFNGSMLMLNRAFFSLQASWVPTAVALGNLGVNGVLDAAFYRLGVWGIPLATSFVNIAGTAALVILLRRRLGRLELGETIRTLLLVTLASVALAGAAYGAWRGLDDLLGRSLSGQIVSVGGGLCAGAAAYLISCYLLRVREFGALLSLLTRLRRG
jgi:putative peptidoglycan lipid II flippase